MFRLKWVMKLNFKLSEAQMCDQLGISMLKQIVYFLVFDL